MNHFFICASSHLLAESIFLPAATASSSSADEITALHHLSIAYTVGSPECKDCGVYPGSKKYGSTARVGRDLVAQ